MPSESYSSKPSMAFFGAFTIIVFIIYFNSPDTMFMNRSSSPSPATCANAVVVVRPPRADTFDGGAPNAAQQAILLQLKKAWGGTFFGAETWHGPLNGKPAPADSWTGVEWDVDGNVVGIELLDAGVIGVLPPSLAELFAISKLDLSANFLVGSIPDEIASLTQLERLYLSSNSLSGELPPVLGSLKNLVALRLGGNSISGSLPREIGYLENLEDLDVSDNQLNGTLPTEIFRCTRLSSIILGGNRLTGTISEDFGKFEELTFLDLSSNWFWGRIPHSLGQLKNVAVLNLGSNILTGKIPSGFLQYGLGLRTLILANNHLTGELPLVTKANFSGSVAWGSELVLYDVSNNFFYGQPMIDVNGKGIAYCPDVYPDRFIVNGNCLSGTPTCSDGGARPVSECLKFCGTTSKARQCGGHGTCVLAKLTTLRAPSPACWCDPGFARPGRNPLTCVKTR